MFDGAWKSDAMQVSDQCHRRRTLKDAHFRDDEFIIFSFGDDGGRTLPREPADGEKSTYTRTLLPEKVMQDTIPCRI